MRRPKQPPPPPLGTPKNGVDIRSSGGACYVAQLAFRNEGRSESRNVGRAKSCRERSNSVEFGLNAPKIGQPRPTSDTVCQNPPNSGRFRSELDQTRSTCAWNRDQNWPRNPPSRGQERSATFSSEVCGIPPRSAQTRPRLADSGRMLAPNPANSGQRCPESAEFGPDVGQASSEIPPTFSPRNLPTLTNRGPKSTETYAQTQQKCWSELGQCWLEIGQGIG